MIDWEKADFAKLRRIGVAVGSLQYH